MMFGFHLKDGLASGNISSTSFFYYKIMFLRTLSILLTSTSIRKLQNIFQKIDTHSKKIKKSDNANGKFSISRNSDIEMRIHLKNVFLIDAIGQRWNIFLVTKIIKMEPVLIILRQFLFFLRIGQPQPLFCLILFFSTYSLQKKLQTSAGLKLGSCYPLPRPQTLPNFFTRYQSSFKCDSKNSLSMNVLHQFSILLFSIHSKATFGSSINQGPGGLLNLSRYIIFNSGITFYLGIMVQISLLFLIILLPSSLSLTHGPLIAV